MTPVVTYIRKHWLISLFVLIVILLAGSYLLGYRIGPGVTLERVGTLSLENLPTGTSIYTDEASRGTTAATSTKNVELVAGSHSVIVSTPGDFPWNALVSITSGVTTQVDPILIPMKPNATPLSGADAAAANTAIASTTLPTESNPIHLENGCAAVYVTNNQIIAEATTTPGATCTTPTYLCLGGSCDPTIIFSPTAPISGVFAYPGRQDALVVGVLNTLYGIALDPRSPQFFAPILTASNPFFGVLPNGTIVVKNNLYLFSVKL